MLSFRQQSPAGPKTADSSHRPEHHRTAPGFISLTIGDFVLITHRIDYGVPCHSGNGLCLSALSSAVRTHPTEICLFPVQGSPSGRLDNPSAPLATQRIPIRVDMIFSIRLYGSPQEPPGRSLGRCRSGDDSNNDDDDNNRNSNNGRS